MAIEVTGNLSSPATWNTAGVTIDTNTSTRLEGHDNTPISADESRFIRLKVSQWKEDTRQTLIKARLFEGGTIGAVPMGR